MNESALSEISVKFNLALGMYNYKSKKKDNNKFNLNWQIHQAINFNLVSHYLNLLMQGCTWEKQAFVKSPRRANELCLTSGIGSCIHWYSRCIMLLLETRASIWLSSPSARPDKRSRATIMKSLSGASNCSGFWEFACRVGGGGQKRGYFVLLLQR